LEESDFIATLIRLGNQAIVSKDEEIQLGVVMTLNNLVSGAVQEALAHGAVSMLKEMLKSNDSDIVRESSEVLAVLLPDQGLLSSRRLIFAASVIRPMSFIRESHDSSKSKTIRIVSGDQAINLVDV
jgi:hypothetical protein